MYNPYQTNNGHHYDSPYSPQTYTSPYPAEMYHAPINTSSLPLRPEMMGNTSRHEAIPYIGNGRRGDIRRGQRSYCHESYGPGDWVPDPRIGLGISTSGHSELVPPHMAPHTSYHLGRPDHNFDIPPLPYRSITLDSTSSRARSSYATPPHLRYPVQQESFNGTRTASQTSNRSSLNRNNPHHDRNGKPWPKPRLGGPPKAPLGGAGGKPWDERLKEDRSVSSPLPHVSQNTPLGPVPDATEEVGPTFKGNPVIFRPPPLAYLPENSPELPGTNLASEGGQEHPGRVSRKDVYPWPVQPPRGPPDTIPLPPSPIDQDPEGSGRRTWTSIASTDSMEPSEGAIIKGKRKKVVVALPKGTNFAEQQVPDREQTRKQQIWDAVHVRPVPDPQDNASQSSTKSPGDIKNEITERHHTSFNSSSTPDDDHSSIQPSRIRSPPTPTRRGQSSTALGNSAFVRRQLGGMLRSSPSSRSARGTPSTTSIPENNSSDKGHAHANQTMIEARRDKIKASDGMTGEVESRSKDEDTKSSLMSLIADMPARGAGLSKGRSMDELTNTLATPGPAVRPLGFINRDRHQNDLAAQIARSDGIEEAARATAGEIHNPERRQDNISRNESGGPSSPLAKRLRPTAEPYEPQSRRSSGSGTTPINTAPGGRLRPTASAFVPRSTSVTASSIRMPAGTGGFTFSAENIKHRGMGSWSSVLSDVQQPIDEPGKSESGQMDSHPLLGHEDTLGSSRVEESLLGRPGSRANSEDQEGTPSTPDEQHTESHLDQSPSACSHTVSEPSRPSHSLGSDDESDLPTARPLSVSGAEERFSTRQDTVVSRGSPAAELHGIFASPDRHSSPPSEISESIEALSESFDPVSYSYETDTESTYEVSSTAVFFTSTPRGGHQVLPMESHHSGSDSGMSSPEEYHTVPTVNVTQDPRTRFLEWTFPSNRHGRMPSIHRRHTFNHLDPQEDGLPESPKHGVASTFASRVGDLRAHLAKSQGGKNDHLRVTSGPDGNLSTRSSAEFPMRSSSKHLAVVNVSEGTEASPDERFPPNSDRHHVVKVDDLSLPLAELDGKVGQILKALGERPNVDLSPLTQMLEQQSTLISSLANATQQNRGHQNDHLIPLLEGQQAVLEKLSTVESTQTDVTDLLERLDLQHSGLVGELRSELAVVVGEKAELAERLHRIEMELVETRQSQIAKAKQVSETRDNLDIAQSRNAALELHLQSLVKEKQATAQEREEEQAAWQRQAFISERSKADLDAKQAELLAEKRQNEILQETIRSQATEELELQKSTLANQEALVERLSRIEEGVQGTSVSSEAFTRLQDQNERLQREVDNLKEKHLLAVQEKHDRQTEATAAVQELEQLRKELSSEQDLRQKAEERANAADEALQKESVSRFQAQMIAKERSHFANMQEVQLGARTRECNYWQTFALTYDRNAYRNYLKSKPFHGVAGYESTGSATPTNKGSSGTNVIPTYEELQATKAGSSGEKEKEQNNQDANKEDQETPTKAKLKGKEVATMDEDTEAWLSGDQ